MSGYEQDVIKSSEKNHIWLNAFQCIRPTDDFKISLANQILSMMDRKENLIYPWQDSESYEMRELGKLTPELIVRINKS